MQGVSYEDISRESATGKAYLHNHTDIYGRPALVVRVSRCTIVHLLPPLRWMVGLSLAARCLLHTPPAPPGDDVHVLSMGQPRI